MTAYASSIDNAVTAFREWRRANPDVTLSDNPWELPKDCPLWHLNLSLAQVSGVLGTVLGEEAARARL